MIRVLNPIVGVLAVLFCLAGCAPRVATDGNYEGREVIMDRKAFLALAQQAASDSMPQVIDSTEYRDEVIYPGDQLGIGLFEKLPVSMEKRVELRRVDSRGNVFLLPMGQLHVAGLTTHEAEELLKKELSEFVVSPHAEVSVTEREAGTKQVYVFGEVINSGTFPIRGGNYRLLDALSDAEGAKLDAYRRSVKIIRPGKEVVTMVSADLQDILKEGDLSQNYQLQDQDIVFVPRRFYTGFQEVMSVLGPLIPWYNFFSAFTGNTN